MPEGTPTLSKRDRALAELVRVRGWADDEAIERAISGVSASGQPGLGIALVAAGILKPEQLRVLEDAIDGVSARSRSAPSAGSASDRTVARVGPSGSAIVNAKKAPDTVGPYRLLRELGRGGMGIVYRALDPELRREVALKLMIGGQQASEADAERFRREAALVARMGRHPHLIQIHDIGRDDDRLYFTMDFIEGRSAKQRVEDEGPFSSRDAAVIAADIAGALAFAHAAGVVHRDVKPHNLLLDRDGKAFLGDFGLAKDLSGSVGLTESGSAFGTPAYMSPEQAAGQASRAGAPSDVYSLGASLYELITGKPPFTGESGMEIVRKVLDSDPIPPRSVRDGIHRDLEVICLKAMHKDISRRYPSASEMEADLRRFLNGEPILARPAGPVEKLLVRARRHRAVVAVALAGLVVASAIGGVAGWKIHRREADTIAAKKDLEERAKRATPLLLDGIALIDRYDVAHRSGGWADRDRYAPLAVAKLEEAAGIHRENPDIHYELARAYRRAGRRQEALRALEKAVEINPRHSLAWFEHGSLLEEELARGRGKFLRGGVPVVQNDVGFRPTGVSADLMTWETQAVATAELEPIRARAAEDFQKVVATGAVAERAAYGRAMLAYYEGKPAEALKELNQALKVNRYFIEARKARAEILESETRDPKKGLPDREELHLQQPHNPELAVDYAMSLALTGDAAGALRELAALDALKLEAPEVLEGCARVALSAGNFEKAGAYGRRLMGAAKDGEGRIAGIRVAIVAAMSRGRLEEAAALVEENESLLGAEASACARGEIAFLAGNFAACARHLRKVNPATIHGRFTALTLAYAEWMNGNLDPGMAAAERAIVARIAPAERGMRGILRMEKGDLKGALEDFEAVRKLYPAFNSIHSNLAGARFLAHDYAGAIQSLEDAVTATPLPDAQRQAIGTFFGKMREDAAKVKTPAEAAKIVERLTVVLELARGQVGADPTAGAAVKEGLRGLYYILQEFYLANGMPKQAIGAGKRYLVITSSGGVLYKDARARALAGRKTSPLKKLAEAIAQGFEDGARLDADPAFERFRGEAEYRRLRGLCR